MKTYRMGISMGAVCLAVAAGLAAAPPGDGGLTASPGYQKECAKCHGKTAEGRHFAGPSLVNAKTAGASSEDLRKIITDGKAHMPKFAGKLSAEEIDTLVQQIQALNKK